MGNLCDVEEIGLPRSRDYLIAKWTDGDKEVFFSYTQQGNAIGIHIAAKRKHRFALRKASEEFIQYLFARYTWCRMILCLIRQQSVINLAIKCKFEKVCEFPDKGYTLMMRKR